jgi:glycosyltransferase involved in cell wall biosynthesis
MPVVSIQPVKTWVGRLKSVFESFVPSVSSAPPPPFKAHFKPFFVSFFSTTILLLAFLNWISIFANHTFGAQIGLFFASISLATGTVFFAYSMKYYLSLALVLSFSSRENGGVGEIGESGKNGGVGGWLRRIFSAEQNSSGLPAEALSEGAKAGGLQANLDHIKLERYPFISIQLPFYNEKKVANRIISACTSMDYPNFEVIVCDDSTDETVDIVNEWKNHPRVRILHRPTREGFKGGALSYALKAMDPRTEFVCVFDADFVPYPDSLMQFIKYFKSTGGWSEEKVFRADSVQTMPYSTFGEVPREGEVPQVSQETVARGTCGTFTTRDTFTRQEEELRAKGTTAVVAGYQWHVLNKSENWITRGVRTEYSGSYVIERPAQEIVGAMKIIHGSVYCMRADVMKHFGWGTSITEDYEMTLRIYEKGFKVCYTPYVQAPSECVSTIKRLIRQRMRWAEGHSFNTRKMFGKLMFGYWKTEDRGLMTDDGRLMAETDDRGLMTDDGLQTTEDRGQTTDDGKRITEVFSLLSFSLQLSVFSLQRYGFPVR